MIQFSSSLWFIILLTGWAIYKSSVTGCTTQAPESSLRSESENGTESATRSASVNASFKPVQQQTSLFPALRNPHRPPVVLIRNMPELFSKKTERKLVSFRPLSDSRHVEDKAKKFPFGEKRFRKLRNGIPTTRKPFSRQAINGDASQSKDIHNVTGDKYMTASAPVRVYFDDESNSQRDQFKLLEENNKLNERENVNGYFQNSIVPPEQPYLNSNQIRQNDFSVRLQDSGFRPIESSRLERNRQTVRFQEPSAEDKPNQSSGHPDFSNAQFQDNSGMRFPELNPEKQIEAFGNPEFRNFQLQNQDNSGTRFPELNSEKQNEAFGNPEFRNLQLQNQDNSGTRFPELNAEKQIEAFGHEEFRSVQVQDENNRAIHFQAQPSSENDRPGPNLFQNPPSFQIPPNREFINQPHQVFNTPSNQEFNAHPGFTRPEEHLELNNPAFNRENGQTFDSTQDRVIPSNQGAPFSPEFQSPNSPAFGNLPNQEFVQFENNEFRNHPNIYGSQPNGFHQYNGPERFREMPPQESRMPQFEGIPHNEEDARQWERHIQRPNNPASSNDPKAIQAFLQRQQNHRTRTQSSQLFSDRANQERQDIHIVNGPRINSHDANIQNTSDQRNFTELQTFPNLKLEELNDRDKGNNYTYNTQLKPGNEYVIKPTNHYPYSGEENRSRVNQEAPNSRNPNDPDGALNKPPGNTYFSQSGFTGLKSQDNSSHSKGTDDVISVAPKQHSPPKDTNTGPVVGHLARGSADNKRPSPLINNRNGSLPSGVQKPDKPFPNINRVGPRKGILLKPRVPLTSFLCADQRGPGFFADPEAGCRVFHSCDVDMRKNSFMCPAGTLFNQIIRVCDWPENVDCPRSPQLYHLQQDKKDHVSQSSEIEENIFQEQTV